MEEKDFEKFVEEYEVVEKKYGLPSFEKMQEDFDIGKLAEKEGGIFIRGVRRVIAEKIAGYLHFFETLLNPSSPPMFVFSFLKNLKESDKKEIKEIYKELARMQIKLIKMDTMYSEKTEIEFIKKTFSDWQKIKKQIYALVEIFEKEFEKSAVDKERSYFG
jgi:hypothetical protein